MRSLPVAVSRVKVRSVGVVAGRVGQQSLVHAAEFFAAEVAVVDRAGGAGDRVVDLGQRADRLEERAVGQLGAVEDAQGVAAVEGGAQRAQAQCGQAVAGKGVGDDLVGLPQVGVPSADVLRGHSTQPRGGEVLGVELAGCGVGVRRVQQVAVFGDEQHDQPVGDAQQRAVQVAVGIGCGSEGFAQRGVGGVGEEAGAQLLQRGGDALLQGEQCPGAVLDGGEPPLLEPAVRQFGGGSGCRPRRCRPPRRCRRVFSWWCRRVGDGIGWRGR